MTPVLIGGIVVKGQVTIIYDGKKEIANAGDARYFPPGHTGMVEADTEVWEFSPADKLKKTMEVNTRNMEAMQKSKTEQTTAHLAFFPTFFGAFEKKPKL